VKALTVNYQKQRQLMGLLFVLPVVLGTVAFDLIPTAISFVASFTDWSGLKGAKFVGLGNYIKILTGDRLFRITLGNTLYYTFGTIPLTLAAGLALALLINQKLPTAGFFKGLYFAPVVTSEVAIGVVWSWILAPDYGLLNNLLKTVGIAGPAWLYQARWAMPAIIIVSVWRGAGYNMVLYLAGLKSIPTQFYDAAKIDGAGNVQQFLYITWPLLAPTTFFILIMSFIGSFQVFGLIYVMTEGGPGSATTVYIYYLYQNAFHFFKMGYACSLAWLLFVVMAAVTMFQWRMRKKWVSYE
jgi:ABC-type sugar transport system permease subunit